MENFVWTPGHGPDQAALSRLKSHFPRPKRAMGEAWFMSEKRRFFHELMGDLPQVPLNQIQKVLDEAVSGPQCFGYRPEWDEWFHYLLVHSISRSHEQYVHYLLEHQISGVMATYPEIDDQEPYPDFMTDLLNTLGQVLMDPAFWQQDRVIHGTILHDYCSHRRPELYWQHTSGDFSASMFFCLKYLHPTQIGPWLDSVAAIDCPHWQAQLFIWLTGAYEVIYSDRLRPEPSTLDFCYPQVPYPSVSWASNRHAINEHVTMLGGNRISHRVYHFLPPSQLQAARRTLTELVTVERYRQWQAAFASQRDLSTGNPNVSNLFLQQYLPRHPLA